MIVPLKPVNKSEGHGMKEVDNLPLYFNEVSPVILLVVYVINFLNLTDYIPITINYKRSIVIIITIIK